MRTRTDPTVVSDYYSARTAHFADGLNRLDSQPHAVVHQHQCRDVQGLRDPEAYIPSRSARLCPRRKRMPRGSRANWACISMAVPSEGQSAYIELLAGDQH